MKNTLLLIVLFTSTVSFSQSESVILAPQYIDLSASISQSAILMNVNSYLNNTARYRLFNGSNYFYVWDEIDGLFESSNSYSNNPLIPGDESTIAGSTWWIIFQRGNNNNLTATFGTRLDPYTNPYRTLLNAVNATSLTNPFYLTGNVTAGGGYNLTVKYVVLGYDAVLNGNLLCAASTDLTTGNYSLSCHGGTTIKRIEFRTIDNVTITSATNSIGWTTTTSIGSTILPVELSSFSAINLDNTVKLNWRTETEVSNYGFEILRAHTSTPLSVTEWDALGFVEGHGNSNSPKEYSFTDDLTLNPALTHTLSYRLKQIDTDGSFEYSKVIEIDLGSPAKFELSQNYPNPFNPVTTIQFTLPQPGNVKLILYNILGEQVAELVNEFKDAGVHTINFNAFELNSGVYIYKLESNGFVQSRKMMLVK